MLAPVSRMGELLDELNVLTGSAVDLDIALLDKKVDQMMPELGFGPDDNDRLVASYRCLHMTAYTLGREHVLIWSLQGTKHTLFVLASILMAKQPCSI